jgi:hypothetical protein
VPTRHAWRLANAPGSGVGGDTTIPLQVCRLHIAARRRDI